MPVLLICNGFLHPMTDRPAFRGDLLVDGGKILRVERRIDPSTMAPEKVIDASGWHICPGLIDAHAHLPQTDGNGWRELTEAAVSAGVTGIVVWPDEDGAPCMVYHGQEKSTAAGTIARLVPEALTQQALEERMHGAARSGVTLACEAYREQEIRQLLCFAEKTGCRLILAHAVDGGALLNAFSACDVSVVLGACCRRGGESAYALAARFRKAGVQVALTADYPATRLCNLPLCAGLCVRAGMKGEEALRTVTIDAARTLGIDGECGTIEPGKRADLTLFDGDPLMLASDHVMTILNGEVVGR